MRSIKSLFVVVFLVALFPVTASPAGAGGLQTWTGEVIYISDGDTFDVRLTNGEVHTVRLAGINTNEKLREPNCWALEATDRLDELIMGKTVKLKARSKNSMAQGRLFRHVFLGKKNIAEKMLQEGYGVPFVKSQEFDYIDTYVAAFYRAFDAGIGMHDEDYCGVGPAADIEMLVVGDADGTDSENPNGEYVQLRNHASTPLSMAGWTMHDSATDYWAFPSSASIPPGGVLTIHAGAGTDTATHLYMDFGKEVFSSIDGAFLYDPDGDMRAFQSWPCDGMCGSGKALPRVVIDEVQYDGPGNDSADPNVEWVRIRNVDNHAVDLRDWSFFSKPYVVYSTISRVLQPGETLTLYVGQGNDSTHEMYWGKTGSILNNEGDSIALISKTGDVVACQAWGSRSCGATRARGFERNGSDFDADGYDDLVVGVPGEDFDSKTNAGSVVVIPGKDTGLDKGAGKTWSQKGKIAGKPQKGDQFGSAVATGDFNGDGYDDLAIGVPAEDVSGVSNAGQVNVIYGSRSGLRSSGNKAFSQKNLAGSLGTEDRFGSALAAGDFNGDGYFDLAVGVPGEDTGGSNAGSVNLIYGSASGLTTTGNKVIGQTVGSASDAESGDAFGSALAAGDFDRDGYDDLAAGAPGDSVGAASAGQVTVSYGSASGLWTAGATAFSQAGLAGDPETGDKFGASIGAGDINGDGFDDLAVGSPGEGMSGKAEAGQVNVVYGSASGLTTAGNASFSQAGDIAGSPTFRDRFGSSVRVGDFDGDGFGDVLAGAPGEDRSGKNNAGAFHVIHGSANGAGVARNKLYDHAKAGGAAKSGDKFGRALGVLDIDGDGRVEVVAGSGLQDLSQGANAGSVGIVFGRAEAQSGKAGMKVSQNGAVPGKSEKDDRFGQAL